MRKILIVEDQPEIRELIRLTLEFDGYDIYEAGCGHEGLTMAEAHRPDLLLLDVMMPGGMDGIEVCRHLRAHPSLRQAKIVMLSVKTQAEDESAGMSAGADLYLPKPFNPVELLHIVKHTLA